MTDNLFVEQATVDLEIIDGNTENQNSTTSSSWVWVEEEQQDQIDTTTTTTMMNGMTTSDDGQTLTTANCRDIQRIVGPFTIMPLPQPSPFSSSLLQRLCTLELVDCRYMTELREDSFVKQELPLLKNIVLKRCYLLTSLPSDWSRLQALQKLEIIDLPLLVKLPDTLGTLSSLKRLVVSYTAGCQNRALQQLPADLPSSLQEIVLDKCKALTSLPDSICRLTKLQRLVLRQAKALQALPESLGNCTALRELNCLKCSNLTHLPATMQHLPALEDLILFKCKALVKLWHPHHHDMRTTSKTLLPCLATLDVQHCKSLQSLPTNLFSLRVLKCNNCPSLTTIPKYHDALLMWDVRECPVLQEEVCATYPVSHRACPLHRTVERKRSSHDMDHDMDNSSIICTTASLDEYSERV